MADKSHLDALAKGVEDMYENYRDIDEDALLAQLSPEELAMLNEDLEREFCNPSQVTSYRRVEKNYAIDEDYTNQEAEDAAALQRFLAHENNYRFERQVPDHIRYLQDPSGFRPLSPSEMGHGNPNAARRESTTSSAEYVPNVNRPGLQNSMTQSQTSLKSQNSSNAEIYDVNGRQQIEVEFYDPNNPPDQSDEESRPKYRTAEEAALINHYKKQEMLAKHSNSVQPPPETIKLKASTHLTKENVKYENDPGLRFQPKLRKAKSPVRNPLPQQSYDEEEINTNVPEDIVRRVAMNDPELTEINLNNIIGVPEDLYLALCEALARNIHVVKLNLSNTGIKDRVAKAIGNVLKGF